MPRMAITNLRFSVIPAKGRETVELINKKQQTHRIVRAMAPRTFPRRCKRLLTAQCSFPRSIITDTIVVLTSKEINHHNRHLRAIYKSRLRRFTVVGVGCFVGDAHETTHANNSKTARLRASMREKPTFKSLCRHPRISQPTGHC